MKTAILSLLIAIIVAGFSIYQFENNKQETVQTEQSLANIESKIAKTDSDAKQMNLTLTELLKKYQSLTLEGDWKISEVSHFLRLAAIELQISRDVPTSLRLMDAADALLSTMPDPKYFSIRDQIAKEKSALQAVKLPDLEKNWSEVGALIDQIPTLPTRGIRNQTPENEQTLKQTTTQTEKNLATNQVSNLSDQTKTQAAGQPEIQAEKEVLKNSSNASPNASSEDTSAKTSSSFEKGLQTTWHELKDLIKIQRHTSPIEPILQEPEQALAKENLLLLFEQIRWAILHSNNVVYQRSIIEAKQWLNQYFEVNDNRVQHFQETLNELAKIDLRPSLPNIGQALKELQNKG